MGNHWQSALWAPVLLNIGQSICILASMACFVSIALYFRDEFISGVMVNMSVPIWQFFLCTLSILAIIVGISWFFADLTSWNIPRTLSLFRDTKERYRIKIMRDRKAQTQA